MRNVQRESWCHGRSLIPHNRYLKSDRCSNRRSSFKKKSGRLRAMSHMLSRTCVGDTCEMGYPIVHRLRSLYIRKRRQRECKGSTSDLRPALWRSPSFFFFIFRSRTRPHSTTRHAPRGSLLHRKPFGRTTADMHLTGLYVTIVVAFLHASGSAVSTAKNVDAMPSMRGPVPPSGPSPIHN